MLEERERIGDTMQTRELYLVTLQEQNQTARNTATVAGEFDGKGAGKHEA